MFILGGGSPKNFMLQTEPQIQEVLGIDENAATTTSCSAPTRAPTPAACAARRPTEAVTGARSTPTSCPTRWSATPTRRSRCRCSPRYALAKRAPRKLKRLYDRRDELLDRLRKDYRARLKKKG